MVQSEKFCLSFEYTSSDILQCQGVPMAHQTCHKKNVNICRAMSHIMEINDKILCQAIVWILKNL